MGDVVAWVLTTTLVVAALGAWFGAGVMLYRRAVAKHRTPEAVEAGWEPPVPPCTCGSHEDPVPVEVHDKHPYAGPEVVTHLCPGCGGHRDPQIRLRPPKSKPSDVFALRPKAPRRNDRITVHESRPATRAQTVVERVGRRRAERDYHGSTETVLRARLRDARLDFERIVSAIEFDGGDTVVMPEFVHDTLVALKDEAEALKVQLDWIEQGKNEAERDKWKAQAARHEEWKAKVAAAEGVGDSLMQAPLSVDPARVVQHEHQGYVWECPADVDVERLCKDEDHEWVEVRALQSDFPLFEKCAVCPVSRAPIR